MIRHLVRGAALVLALLSSAGPGRAQADASGLAPGGKLRAAMVVGHSALVSRDSKGESSGLAVEVIKALADHVGAVSEVVPYDNQTRLYLSIGKEKWDVAFMPRDLSRTSQLAFSAPILEVDNSYVGGAALAATSAQDIDRSGVRVGVVQGSALDGFLSRSLKSAAIVRLSPGLSEARQALVSGRVDAFADSTAQAWRLAAEVPGGVVLPGRLNAVQVVFAVAKAKAAALEVLNGFVSESKREGSPVREVIQKSDLRGVRIAR